MDVLAKFSVDDECFMAPQWFTVSALCACRESLSAVMHELHRSWSNNTAIHYLGNKETITALANVSVWRKDVLQQLIYLQQAGICLQFIPTAMQRGKVMLPVMPVSLSLRVSRRGCSM